MSFPLNQVTLIGRAGTVPSAYIRTDGVFTSRLRLYLPPPPGKTQSEAFRLVASGALARQLCRKIKTKDRLLVQGCLRNRSFKRAGITHLRTEIVLTGFCRLAAPVSSNESLTFIPPVEMEGEIAATTETETKTIHSQ